MKRCNRKHKWDWIGCATEWCPRCGTLRVQTLRTDCPCRYYYRHPRNLKKGRDDG